MPLPIDVRVALAPRDTYRELIAELAPGSWRRALERPALLAAIIGTAVTISAAERVPLGLVLMGIVCWSFVLVLQLIVGAIVTGLATAKSISMARSIELLFIAHLPWTLWVLIMTGQYRFISVGPGLAVEVAGLLVPGVWTAVTVSAFCQIALGCSPRRARLLTAVHQAMIWTIFFTYVFFVSGFWARIVALVGR